MRKRKRTPADFGSLRQKAEKFLINKKLRNGSQFSEANSLKLIHELEVHQIELEMQNEELRMAKSLVDVASQKYLELYDLAPSGYFTLSKEGTILELNVCGSKMLGVNHPNSRKSAFDLFVSIESKPIFNVFLRKIFKSNTMETCEVTLVRKGYLPISVYLAGSTTHNGEQCVVNAVDISECRHAEEALRESQEHNRSIILQTAMDGFWQLDMQGRILEVNETYCQMSGYSMQELLVMNLSGLEVEEAAKDTATHISMVVELGEDRFETRHRRKDGSIIDVEISVQYQPIKGGRFFAFLHDITERKKAEEALIESEQRYRSLFEESKDAIFLVDLTSGRYMDCNRLAESLTGFTREEILRMKTGSFLSPQRKVELVSNMEAIMSGNVLRRETEIITRSGNLISVEFNASIITINKKQYILSLLHDISERKATDEALRRKDDLLNKAEEIAHLGSWSLDLTTNRLTWSDEIYRIFGLQLQEFPATLEGFLDAVHPEDRDAVNSAYTNSIIEDRDSYEIEHRIVRKYSGEIRHVFEKCEHIRDASGKIVRSVGMVHDITERKQAAEAIMVNERLLRDSQAVAHIGSYSADLIHNTWKASPELYEIFGVDETYPHTLEGWLERIHPDYRAALSAYLCQVETEKKRFDHEYKIFRFNDGKERWVHGLGEIICDHHLNPVRMIGTIQDITKRKQGEEALKQLNEELENRVKERSAELLNVTVKVEERERNRFSRELHDGLGPLLSTIKLYFQWLAETKDVEKVKIISEKGNKYIEKAIQTTREVALGLSSVVLNNLGYIDTLLNFTKSINETKKLNIDFTFNSKDRLSFLLETTLYSITTELINNTLKYAKATQVEIVYNYYKELNLVTFNYFDNGIGFDLESVKINSKGLGLINIQQRIDILDGKMSIDTGIGKGIKVSIELWVNETMNSQTIKKQKKSIYGS